MSKRTVTISMKGMFTLKNTLRNFDKGRGMRMKEDAARSIGAAAYERVLANVSRKDFSLNDLRSMGHPYARRNGSIAVNPGQEYLVNTHSGRLRNSLGHRVVTRTGGAGGGKNKFAQVGFINNPPEYANYVVAESGTRIMLPRDPINETVQSKEFKKVMLDLAASAIKKNL